MSARIFISYRRSDDPGFVGRLYDRLEAHYGMSDVFYDVAAIEPGNDFTRKLQEQVEDCEVLLAVIGPDWIDAVDEKGVKRLNKEQDWVRIEIEAALRLGKAIIPILVDKTNMPTVAHLPSILHRITDLQAARLTHEGFRSEVGRLIDLIDGALRKAEDQKRREIAARQAQADRIGNLRALRKLEIDKRVEGGVMPTRGIRVIARSASGFLSTLGHASAPFVFFGDFDEYKGRFLKDVVRDMYGMAREDSDVDWYALKFEIDPKELSTLQIMPATMEAIYHLATDFRGWAQTAQEESIDFLWERRFRTISTSLASAGSAYEADRWLNHIDGSLRGDGPPIAREFSSVARFTDAFRFLQQTFGIDACYNTLGRGRSEFSARHFVMRNLAVDRMNFEVQQLGRARDLVILT